MGEWAEVMQIWCEEVGSEHGGMMSSTVSIRLGVVREGRE